MVRKSVPLATAILVATSFAQTGLAADPSGSTPSAPRPSAPTPAPIPMPDRGPTDLTIGRFVPPEPIDDLTAIDPNAARDQQIDAILGATLPDDGFGFASASNGGEAESHANCYSNGVGCPGGSQAQFEADCHSQGGGLSSHDGEDGPFVRCTQPPN